MTAMSLRFLGCFFFFFLLLSSEAQTIIGFSSSFPHSDLPSSSPPQPTKQTAIFWPSLPPRGRSDVPIRATVQERRTATNAVQQLQRGSHPTEPSTPGFRSALSTQSLSSRPVVTQPTSSRARTDTASLSSSGKAEKGSTLPLPTLSSFTVAEPAGDKPVTRGKPKQELFKETEDDGLQELGSGSILTVTPEKDESPVPTVGDEMAQYQPPAQTVISKVLALETTPDSQTLKPRPPLLTTANKISTTPQTTRITVSPVVTQATPRTDVLTGEKSNILELMLCENKVQSN